MYQTVVRRRDRTDIARLEAMRQKPTTLSTRLSSNVEWGIEGMIGDDREEGYLEETNVEWGIERMIGDDREEGYLEETNVEWGIEGMIDDDREEGIQGKAI